MANEDVPSFAKGLMLGEIHEDLVFPYPIPDRDEVELYWGLHFALAMSHHTIRDSERLTKLSEGLCDLNDVEGIIERIVAVSVKALTAGAPASKMPARTVVPHGRLTRQDL